MLSDTAVVVEVCLCVPVTAAPLAFAVRDRPSHVILAENFLAVHEGSNVCQTCTITVLTILLSCIL